MKTLEQPTYLSAMKKTPETIAIAALWKIFDPIKHLQQEAEKAGAKLDGVSALTLAKDPQYLKNIAQSALFEINELEFVRGIPAPHFTCMVDKHGRRIVNGDKVTHKLRRIWKTSTHTSTVVWDSKWASFYLDDGSTKHRMRWDMEFEIVTPAQQS